MAARHSSCPATAMPIEVDPRDTRSGIDERTYEFLEEVWNSAVRYAEQAPRTEAVEATPREYTSRATENLAHAMPVPRQQADTTRLSSLPHSGEAGMAVSPLPRAPPVLPRTTSLPLSVSPVPQQRRQQQQKQQPLQRRPVASSKTSWMRVEAQPNLKRNGYTSHRGVAWVVQ